MKSNNRKNLLTPDDIQVWNNFVNGVKPIEREPPKELPRTKPKIKAEYQKNYIDLHGLTIHEAWAATLDYINRSQSKGLRKVRIITGTSGIIRREFPGWLASQNFKKLISSYSEINQSSFLVYIRRPNKTRR